MYNGLDRRFQICPREADLSFSCEDVSILIKIVIKCVLVTRQRGLKQVSHPELCVSIKTRIHIKERYQQFDSQMF